MIFFPWNKSLQLDVKNIEKYFEDNDLATFISKYEDLLIKKSIDEPFTYWGINFKDEKVCSVKFYAHVIEDMTDEEILQFLPVSEDYKKYIHLKGESTPFNPTNVGTVLEIKFSLTATKPTFGFFYLLKNTEDSYKTLGYPVNLPQEIIAEGVGLGVNFEYSEGQTKFKRYYYYNRPEDKLFFEKKMKTLLLGDFYEYAEGYGLTKLNNYSGFITDFWKRDKIFSRNEKKVIKYFYDKFDFSIIGSGSYQDHPIKSIYFREGKSQTKSMDNTLTQYSNVFKYIRK